MFTRIHGSEKPFQFFSIATIAPLGMSRKHSARPWRLAQTRSRGKVEQAGMARPVPEAGAGTWTQGEASTLPDDRPERRKDVRLALDGEQLVGGRAREERDP